MYRRFLKYVPVLAGMLLVLGGGYQRAKAGTHLERTAVSGRAYSPPVPIGPPISNTVLRAQDLRFTEQRVGKRDIGVVQAIRVAMREQVAGDSAPPHAFIRSVRFGRLDRTRSPITRYDHHLVWMVVVSGLGGGSGACGSGESSGEFVPCVTPPPALLSYGVIDGVTGKWLVGFRASG
jgi:hypothetical protein